MTAPLDTPDTAARVAREPDWMALANELPAIPAGLPFEQFKPITTIDCHALVLLDSDNETVRALGYCIKESLRELLPALRAQSDPAATQGLETLGIDAAIAVQQANLAAVGLPKNFSFLDADVAATQGLDAVRRDNERLRKALVEVHGFPYVGTAASVRIKGIAAKALALSTPSPLPADADGERRGWQPVETAPKDKTRFDGWRVPENQGNWEAHRIPDVTWSRFGDGWVAPMCGEFGNSDRPAEGYFPKWRLTHWIPSPPPPESSGEQPADDIGPPPENMMPPMTADETLEEYFARVRRDHPGLLPDEDSGEQPTAPAAGGA